MAVASAAMLIACRTPDLSVAKLAADSGLSPLILNGNGFRQTVYLTHSSASAPGSDADQTLDIYLEGDGAPFSTPTVVAADPRPRHALGFELMLTDPGPAAYLVRPCYSDILDPVCDTRYWTIARYGPAVIRSLQAAIIDLQYRTGHHKIRLIGYSGGGVLATLLASRLHGVASLVTIGANLNVSAWTALHGYSPLAESLDPASEPRPDDNIQQYHLYGSADAVVPFPAMKSYFSEGGSRTVMVMRGYDHVCCWLGLWRHFLTQISHGASYDCALPACILPTLNSRHRNDT